MCGKEGDRRVGLLYLERMQQPEPMPDFMHGRLAAIVTILGLRGPGHRARKDVAAIGGVVLLWVFILLACKSPPPYN